MRLQRLGWLVVLLAGGLGCGGGDTAPPPESDAGADASSDGGQDAGPDADTDAGPDGGGGGGGGGGGSPPQQGLCGAKTLKPWSRKSTSIGGAVSFNELMYHPAGNAELEWIELYNPLGIDVDLSGFHLAGAVSFTFPESTFIKAKGFVVVAKNADLLAQALGAPVALGSYTGALPDGDSTVELWNNAGRLLDSLRYDDEEPWPVIPDGSGASLAKRIGGSASPRAESWAPSALVGGTPGAPNFAEAFGSLPPLTLLAPDASFRYLASGPAPAADWASVAFDDTGWAFGPATFFASKAPPANQPVTATFTADNYFALYRGKADGAGLSLLGRDSIGDWTSAESFPFQAAPDDYLFVAAWEAPGDSGGPQSLIGELALPGGAVLGTSATNFEWVLGPPGASPGGALNDPAPAVASLQNLIQMANGSASWASPVATADKASPPWGPALAGVFSPGTQFIWPDTFADVSATNANTTFVLFRSKAPIVPGQGSTEISLGKTTTYFRAKLQVPADVELVEPWIDALVDDGAVFYLDGAEVLRLRMPNGVIGPATLASSTVGEATWSTGHLLAPSLLTPGPHVLAVELHQAALDDPDLTFAASLTSSVKSKEPGGPPAGLAFNEVAGAGGQGFWIELANRGAAPLELEGHVITSAKGSEHLLSPKTLLPGELLEIKEAELGFPVAAGETLFLVTPDRSRVLDGVRIAGVPRARKAGDFGAFLYPDTSTPGEPNVFVEQDAIVIAELMVRAPPVTHPDGSITKSTLEWIELANRGETPVDVSGYQLVDAIEYVIPKGVVIPAGGSLVVANDLAAMKATYPSLANAGPDVLVGAYQGSLADSGETLVLLDACGNPADTVRYAGDGGRFPALAHGGGSSLELRDLRADNMAPEAWAASDEAAASTWQMVSYQGVLGPSSVGPDGAYQELVIGLLDAGQALIDDLQVIEDPAGAAIPLVQNGNFESGNAAPFRLLGNHRHSEVIPDPGDAGNHVLRLVATGPTEHMHNHVETTLLAGHPLTNGKTYQISFRAKWEGGSNQLNTRLYFNRLPKTTLLPLPAFHGTPGAPNSRAEKNIGPTYGDLRHAPAVPKPGEPVRVSVEASDPDSVASLTLWYAVDGQAFQSLPMNGAGGGHHSALVPGAPAGSVIQFYVAAVDGAGAQAFFPQKGPASRALWKVDDGLASTKGLHNLRLVMTKGDADWLFEPKNLMSNDHLGATVIDDEREVFYDVGLRLKSSERGRPETARVGFALSFAPEQPFRGVYESIMVDRSEGIGFGQRELFFNQAMNHAGSVHSHYDDLVKVLTPRPEHVGPAHLQLARFGDLLLDHQFDQGGDGSMFEYELIYYPLTTDDGTPKGNKLPQPDSVVGVGVHDLGPDEEAYRLPFILKNNRWKDDYQGLIHFTQVFGQSGPSFDAQVGDVADVDQWLRAFAFATLSGTVDNYGVGDAHNGNFYVRPGDGKVLYFPHDLDFYGGSPQSAVVASGDLAKLMGTPERSRAYYGHLHDIISTSYNGAYMTYWANHLGALLPAQNFAGHLQFVSARADWVLNGAPNAVTKAIPKVAFQITTNGGAPLAVMTPEVLLSGKGWVDVSTLRQGPAGPAVPLAWPGQTTWQATVPLACGVNAVELDAFDRHGKAVGSDTIEVTRAGAGCP